MFCDFETLSARWLTQKRHLLGKKGNTLAHKVSLRQVQSAAAARNPSEGAPG
jgi:hypothetical protein